MQTYTLHEVPAVVGGADVEVVQQPDAEQHARQHLRQFLAATDEPAAERRGRAADAPGHHADDHDDARDDHHDEAPQGTGDDADDQSDAGRAALRPGALHALGDSVQFVEPLDQGVPRQRGALDAHRELDDAL